MDRDDDHQKFFHFLLIAVTVALCFILQPFFSAIFWGSILALLFQPLQRWLSIRLGKRNLAALLTLTLILLVVILPLVFIVGTLAQEIASVYQLLKGTPLNLPLHFNQAIDMLPSGIRHLLANYGVTNMASVQKKLADGAAAISQTAATQAFSLGQNMFQFVVSFAMMMYMVFFLLRDGVQIGQSIRRAIPLDETHKTLLLNKFTTVVRATVKGNIAVALIQGALGGLIFWILGIPGVLLWGSLMAFLSLLPAVGAGLVWIPAAIYFALSGEYLKCAILVGFCAGVIGLVDNLLRPILVGKDTRMPDWIVLISTFGGMALFGINGFVIGPLIMALFMASWGIVARGEQAQAEASANAAGAADRKSVV